MHDAQSTIHEHRTALHTDRPTPTDPDRTRTHSLRRSRRNCVRATDFCISAHPWRSARPAQLVAAQPATACPAQPSPALRRIAFKASDAARSSEHAHAKIALAVPPPDLPAPQPVRPTPLSTRRLLQRRRTAMRGSLDVRARVKLVRAGRHGRVVPQDCVRHSTFGVVVLLLHDPAYHWTRLCGGLARRGRVLQDAALPDFFRVYKALASRDWHARNTLRRTPCIPFLSTATVHLATRTVAESGTELYPSARRKGRVGSIQLR
ncbi:hypothetical protein HETIRDRAFT_451728 [Heterobasidion irregulare TC 32-1]|uniref:Uncharacterized protein n=1 Tax=Heterobasidion irregulare (strain TC 32-1) TaxID=747525 RepID=W4K8P6_HETIT|nr:uncharacterized protein HETIRDRAFT_451728 [Heterobasidion irregulare TC 32-1]ETW82124.1 hypothetical protein HETIRDRAFT_451728 [Heterobasidion irregulare TC 32-1]